MLFSSMTFLWIFLPLLLMVYYAVPYRCKNGVLLAASILFYAWGEPKYILLIFLSVTVNYLFGLAIDTMAQRSGKEGRDGVGWSAEEAGSRPPHGSVGGNKGAARLLLILCLAVNLGILGYFKYFDFSAELLNGMAGRTILPIRQIVLPLGISFYTFQALSYVMDVCRGVSRAQKNWFTLLLYVMLFPQLIAGPIVKYRDVEGQLKSRSITEVKTACGVRRFVYGLSKKVLLSNTLALYADMIMNAAAGDLSTGAAWLGAVFYALQIYFDFSGYSDMATGLGKMLGFDFMENFNLPYLADSIRDFWRRWHISLSTWFRDYVYIPLGGSRKGPARTCGNLLLVFALTGLWHGAGLNFVVWGLYYGVLLVLERLFLGRFLEKCKSRGLCFVNHLYVMLLVVSGWVLFRLEDLSAAGAYLGRMFIPCQGAYGLAQVLGTKALLTLILGILLCGVMQSFLRKRGLAFWEREELSPLEGLWQAALLGLCVVLLVSGTYNPFIYFRF